MLFSDKKKLAIKSQKDMDDSNYITFGKGKTIEAVKR